MDIEVHNLNEIKVAIINSESVVINTIEDGSELLVNLYYQEFDAIIIHGKNVSPEFFNLKNGMAGELFQKFSNFRMRLAIVGDFSAYSGKSLGEFIHESNKNGQIIFLSTVKEALEKLARV